MEKDNSILNLLDQLESRLASYQYQIVDNWEADQCAIGLGHLKDPRFLIYISTYGKDGKYFASTEFPGVPAESLYKSGSEYDDLDLEELINLIQEHFAEYKKLNMYWSEI